MPYVHLIGIGGAGLSAIATVLLQQGYTISGSDMQSSAMTERLSQLGAKIFIGHRAEQIEAYLDTVVISSAIAADNPEVVAAHRQGIPVVKRAEWLGRMMQDRTGIAIAGTHGKTTTTALTAFVLREAGQDPTYIIGGFVKQMNTNAAAGTGQTFVIEADEYDHMFLGLRPEIAVVTIVEWDHPDIFPTPQALRQDFREFVQRVPPHGLVIGCGDDPGVCAIIDQVRSPVVTYGLTADNDWQAAEIQLNRHGGYDFKVAGRLGQQAAPSQLTISLALPGLHNIYNTLAVLAVAHRQGVDLSQAAEIIGRFQGVGRRFEVKGDVNDMTVIDDYAHHPTEIKATLAAARARFGDRDIWVAFQPHTFSRTLSLLDQFAAAFADADHVIIVDIFPSREADQGLVHSRDIVTRMSHPDARYIGPLDEAAAYLVAHLSPPGVLLTMGAGDGYQIGEWVLESLKE
jgi:UDP-N-acetylmuramate--alanine ligase